MNTAIDTCLDGRTSVSLDQWFKLSISLFK